MKQYWYIIFTKVHSFYYGSLFVMFISIGLDRCITLSDEWIENIFSQSVDYLFILLGMSVTKQMLLILIKFNLSIFLWWILLLVVYLKRHCQIQGHLGFLSFFFIYFFIVVGFVIHWNESAMDLHVFTIPILPPTSLSAQSLWVFPVHQVWALVSCIQPGLVICFTLDNIHVSMLFSWNIPPSPSPRESKRLFYTSVSLFLFCI